MNQSRLLGIALHRPLRLNEIIIEHPELLDYLRAETVVPLARCNRRIAKAVSQSLCCEFSLAVVKSRAESLPFDVFSFLESPGRFWSLGPISVVSGELPCTLTVAKEHLKRKMSIIFWDEVERFSVNLADSYFTNDKT